MPHWVLEALGSVRSGVTLLENRRGLSGYLMKASDPLARDLGLIRHRNGVRAAVKESVKQARRDSRTGRWFRRSSTSLGSTFDKQVNDTGKRLPTALRKRIPEARDLSSERVRESFGAAVREAVLMDAHDSPVADEILQDLGSNVTKRWRRITFSVGAPAVFAVATALGMEYRGSSPLTTALVAAAAAGMGSLLGATLEGSLVRSTHVALLRLADALITPITDLAGPDYERTRTKLRREQTRAAPAVVSTIERLLEGAGYGSSQSANGPPVLRYSLGEVAEIEDASSNFFEKLVILGADEAWKAPGQLCAELEHFRGVCDLLHDVRRSPETESRLGRALLGVLVSLAVVCLELDALRFPGADVSAARAA